MRVSSNLAVVNSSIALLMCCLGGTASAQTRDPGNSLPGVLVEAPKQHAVAPSTVSRRTSATLASATGSCAGGCQTSFRYGNDPWHGCSLSAGVYSSTCRNTGNFKSYAECIDDGLSKGWRNGEVAWYCTSLALK